MLAADPGEADDAARCAAGDRLGDHRGRAGALDDDVELERGKARVVLRAQLTDEIGFAPRVVTVVNVDFQLALYPKQRAHEADRARAGDQYPARRPARATADALDVLPGLGEHARRLEQHRRHTQRRAHVDEKFRRAAKALDREAVRLLDAALGVLPVAAHIPLAERAVDARQ